MSSDKRRGEVGRNERRGRKGDKKIKPLEHCEKMANTSADHSGAYYCTEPEVWNSESAVRVCVYISLYIINAGNCDGLKETNHRGEMHFCCELSQHCISAVRARTPEFPTRPRGFIYIAPFTHIPRSSRLSTMINQSTHRSRYASSHQAPLRP
jgi:hypothetical protein